MSTYRAYDYCTDLQSEEKDKQQVSQFQFDKDNLWFELKTTDSRNFKEIVSECNHRSL